LIPVNWGTSASDRLVDNRGAGADRGKKETGNPDETEALR